MLSFILNRWRELLAAAAIVSIVVLYQANESKAAKLKLQSTINSAQSNMSALDKKYYEEWQDEKAKNDDLLARINRGDVGLRVKATCIKPARVGDAATAELDAIARQDYYALRQGIVQSRNQILALQDIVRQQQATITELSK